MTTLTIEHTAAGGLLEPYQRIHGCIINAIQKGGNNE